MNYFEFKQTVKEVFDIVLGNTSFKLHVRMHPTHDKKQELLTIVGITPDSDLDKNFGNKLTGGFTDCPELGGSEDSVEIFYQGIEYFTQNAKISDSFEETLIQQILKHEFRHAQQILEMRRLGFDIESVYEVESMYKYGEGPLEVDAIKAQTQNRPISDFVEELISTINATI